MKRYILFLWSLAFIFIFSVGCTDLQTNEQTTGFTGFIDKEAAAQTFATFAAVDLTAENNPIKQLNKWVGLTQYEGNTVDGKSHALYQGANIRLMIEKFKEGLDDKYRYGFGVKDKTIKLGTLSVHDPEPTYIYDGNTDFDTDDGTKLAPSLGGNIVEIPDTPLESATSWFYSQTEKFIAFAHGLDEEQISSVFIIRRAVIDAVNAIKGAIIKTAKLSDAIYSIKPSLLNENKISLARLQTLVPDDLVVLIKQKNPVGVEMIAADPVAPIAKVDGEQTEIDDGTYTVSDNIKHAHDEIYSLNISNHLHNHHFGFLKSTSTNNEDDARLSHVGFLHGDYAEPEENADSNVELESLGDNLNQLVPAKKYSKITRKGFVKFKTFITDPTGGNNHKEMIIYVHKDDSNGEPVYSHAYGLHKAPNVTHHEVYIQPTENKQIRPVDVFNTGVKLFERDVENTAKHVGHLAKNVFNKVGRFFNSLFGR